MLGKFGIKAQRHAEAIGIFFRRTREDLKEAMERSRSIYGPIGAVWESKYNWWRFPLGGRLKFEYLDRDADADNYQGHSYTDVFFEELTHWPSPVPVNKLRATLRSAAGVPTQFHATGNPGGPGHQWVKSRYVDPAPLGWHPVDEEFTDPFTGETVTKTRIFIPSNLKDNFYLGADYVANLFQAGSEELVRAWLEGDWSVIEGAYFDWRGEHVIRACALPEHWLRFRSMDWGSARPFSVGWWATASETWQAPTGEVIPKGAMVRFREWYGAKEPNVGLKMTTEAVADGVKERTAEDIQYTVVDPAMFIADGGPSKAETFLKRGVPLRRGDNKRIPGWEQMRSRMKGEDGRPMLYVFNTCADTIRTVPALQHDDRHPEDLDTNGEDHAADEIRYACMSRPYTRPKDEPEDARFERSINEMIGLVKQRRNTSYG